MKVLFVCVENAGRSKMAEAFARRIGLDAKSAGTAPAAYVNPLVVQAMREKGIEIDAKPRLLTAELIDWADTVVTMGCSIEGLCPLPLLISMKKKLIEWHLPDPAGRDIAGIREIRDQIERLVGKLAE
jgi:arsenate reductase